MVVCVADGRSSDAVLTELRWRAIWGERDGGERKGLAGGGRDGRCGWSVVERIGSGKGWCGTVRMVAASWKSRGATGGWLAGERVVGEREGGCTPGIVSNRRVHVHTSIWHIGKAS